MQWILGGFSFERRTAVPKSTLVEQAEQLPYDNHLQEFLPFLKQERGFADVTIVNRQRSLKPFLTWLVGRCIPLSAVSPVLITSQTYLKFPNYPACAIFCVG